MPVKLLQDRIDRAFWKWNERAAARDAEVRATVLLAAVESNRSRFEDVFAGEDVTIGRAETGNIVVKIPQVVVEFWTEVSGLVFSDLTFANWPLSEVDFVGTWQVAEFVGRSSRDEPTDRRGFALRSMAQQVVSEIDLIAGIWVQASSDPSFVDDLAQYCQEQQRSYNDWATGRFDPT